MIELNFLPLPESLTGFRRFEAQRNRDELRSGGLYYEKNGALYWVLNDAPIPRDYFTTAFVEPPIAQAAALSAYYAETIERVRALDAPLSAEALAEMRAEFGVGTEVVNVLTGRRTRL